MSMSDKEVVSARFDYELVVSEIQALRAENINALEADNFGELSRLQQQSLHAGNIKIRDLFGEFKELYRKYCIAVRDIEQITEESLCKVFAEVSGAVRDIEGADSLLFPSPVASSAIHDPQNDVKQEEKPPVHSIKLARLSLPTFDGVNLAQFPGFIESFMDLVDKNPSFSPLEKFHHLLSCLKGQALETVNYLSISGSSYATALQILNKRFINKKLVTKCHLNNLFNLKVVPRRDPKLIRELATKFRQIWSSIEAVGFTGSELANLLIGNLLFEKLDPETSEEIQSMVNADECMPVNETLSRLEKICTTLEALTLSKGPSVVHNHVSSRSPSNHQKSFKSLCAITKDVSVVENAASSNSIKKCLFCSTPNCKGVKTCSKFMSWSPHERFKFCKNHNICLNCMSKGHFASDCKSLYTCKHCQGKHHSLLHFGSASQPPPPVPSDAPAVLSAASHFNKVGPLLPTACAQVFDTYGNPYYVRILLDSGSQSSMITKNMADRLHLPIETNNAKIYGLNKSTTVASGQMQIVVSPINSYSRFCCKALIVPSLPSVPCLKNYPKVIESLPHGTYADLVANHNNQVDILIGVDLYASVLCPDIVPPRRQGGVSLMKSVFGWLVIGGVPSSQDSSLSFLSLSSPFVDSGELSKFWDLESIPDPTLKPDVSTNNAESKFEIIKQLDNGHLQVSLPFVSDPTKLGNSYFQAKRRLISVEKRLDSSPELRIKYSDQLLEYLNLNQMEEVPKNELFPDGPVYYIPHHVVFKSSDTACQNPRIVFDASAITSTGLSLNSISDKGSKLQNNLFNVLINFRSYLYPLVCDIKQMYRRIYVNPSQRDLLRILWRFDSLDKIKVYRLKVLTFGVNSSPYLALLCLNFIASQIRHSHPVISDKILSDMYIDDLCSGANSIAELKSLKINLTSVFENYGMILHKWLSTVPGVSNNSSDLLTFSNDSDIKILGLNWSPANDCFSFHWESVISAEPSKRSILSQVASLFDPLGLIAPVILIAKLLLRDIWAQKLDWDVPVPACIVERWSVFIKNLKDFDGLSISRFVSSSKSCRSFSIHGFADASSYGYGAVVYLQSFFEDGSYQVQLIASKSRVAPLSGDQRCTIPRLELCAASLLVELVSSIRDAVFFKSISKIFLWSDSTVTLCRILNKNLKLPIFEANRIQKIWSGLSNVNWCYVPTNQNPADLVSRGCTPAELKSSDLWWKGPSFLWNQADFASYIPANGPEEPSSFVALVLTHQESNPLNEDSFLHNLLHRFSSLDKLLSILVYVFRFLGQLPNTKMPASPHDLSFALQRLISRIQHSYFKKEILLIKTGKVNRLPKAFRKLSPLWENDLLKVGGRLQASDLPENSKHQLLLPSRHILTDLIINHYHKILHHPGSSSLSNFLLRTFWILGIKKSIRHYTRNCLPCLKAKPMATSQIMAALPASRVTPVPPFEHTGVDFGGPFTTTVKLRGVVLRKAYLCLFICFATKAVHLEVVSDLSSEAFLAAFKRFLARRGNCKFLYSDNGTNFVGANQILKRISSMHPFKGRITWKFNPPYSPSLGGLWEAGIKSAKSHLIKMAGSHPFSFEELSTLFSQIEAMLNSRPLYLNSSDPNDPRPLSPAHFLNVNPPSSLFESTPPPVKPAALKSWQALNHYYISLWNVWSTEYLASLQTRHKWSKLETNLKPGDVVLLKGTSLPLKWNLAKIINCFPGKDGRVRIVEVQAADTTSKRHISSICPLPVVE